MPLPCSLSSKHSSEISSIACGMKSCKYVQMQFIEPSSELRRYSSSDVGPKLAYSTNSSSPGESSFPIWLLEANLPELKLNC